MTIPNDSSCTRLLTPLFSLYRFVISRTSGAEYICPLSSQTARRTNAGPTQAVTSTFTVESLSMPHTVPHTGSPSLGHPNDRHRSPSRTRSPRLGSPRLSGGWPRCLAPGLTARLTFLPGPGLRLTRIRVRLLIIRVLLSQIMSRWRRVDFSSPVTAWAGLALVSRAIRDGERGKYIPPPKF